MATQVVNEGTIQLLIRKGTVLPCITEQMINQAKKARGCNCSKKKKALMTKIDAEAVKECLFTASDSDLAKIKAILRVQQLVFFFRKPGFPPRVLK